MCPQQPPVNIMPFAVHQVTSLLLVASSGTKLLGVRREFQRSMGEAVVLLQDQTAANKSITHNIDELKVSSSTGSIGIALTSDCLVPLNL